ncbi:MAG: DUF3185 family protein [Gammaproteobacteria bacterium]
MPAIRRIIGLAILAAGIVLLVFAFNASHSTASHISNFFTGNPTDKAMWLLIVGIICVIVGLGATFLPFRGFRKR